MPCFNARFDVVKENRAKRKTGKISIFIVYLPMPKYYFEMFIVYIYI